ncbi:hypothetical protein QN277_010630 [Acacia crassicarpa]|uniref:Retrotransposon gag domain-containing protein n=1 Tax=Acacia crassicarpa TaxID=499986 RepID=A0AAE1INX8_9FABA|nr:hypothetical protein QN277_010630 [Acacia crassicarpa]
MEEERFQIIEQRLHTMNTTFEQRLHTMDNTLQGLLEGFNTGMASLQQEMQEFSAAGQNGLRNYDHHQERYQDRRQGQPQYHKPTQFTKMEFPRYSGDDILTWLLKCERFFELDDTPEESKVKMASLNLDDKTFQWHRALERRLRNRLPSWDEYAVLLQDNFGPAFENPMSDLTHLPQTGSLIDYNAEFDFIAAKLDIAEDYLVGAYVSALKPELAGPVQMFKPRTLTKARQLARM